MPGDLLSLYIHIPFCTKRCPYCHFSVFPNQEHWKKRFLSALLGEWNRLWPLISPYTLASIYFGGGTPSLFPQAIEAILHEIRQKGILSPNCEITVEANPETFCLELANTLQTLGVNRLSFGIQSFDPKLLTLLGRTHTKDQGIAAIYHAIASGIDNVSIDLLYDIPNQTLESWENTLYTVESLPISHLSLYNLVFEPHTSFYRQKNKLQRDLPDETTTLLLLEKGCETFARMGLKRYEISAFAKNHLFSIHNTGYWTGRPFLGLGPSAFSYLEGKRFRNAFSLPTYIQLLEKGLSPIDFEEQLSYPANIRELFVIRLRLLEGVDLSSFAKEFAPLPREMNQELLELQEKGLLERIGEKIQLTHRGHLFYDSVASALI